MGGFIMPAHAGFMSFPFAVIVAFTGPVDRIVLLFLDIYKFLMIFFIE